VLGFCTKTSNGPTDLPTGNFCNSQNIKGLPLFSDYLLLLNSVMDDYDDGNDEDNNNNNNNKSLDLQSSYYLFTNSA